MNKSNLPLVSVVTPVYNGEKYLSECIQSVLKQTYSNWEYIILDNCSTDNTLKIAENYAAKDERIKIYTNDKFLKQIPNWNEAVQKISYDSKYCKVVHADDWITPECLSKMVERAEEFPSAGIISAYRFIGDDVKGLRGQGLPYDTTFLTGKEAGRKVMKTPLFLFGSPSTILYRSDLVKAKEKFYNPNVVHADTDACFDILRSSDFGFVHQILSFTRLHNESTSVFSEYYHTHALFDIYAFKKYGNFYLTPEEYKKLFAEKIWNHHHWLAKIMLNGRGMEVWRYHKQELAQMGVGIDRYVMLKAFLTEIVKIKPVLKWNYKILKKFITSDTKNATIKQKKENVVLEDFE